uniref:Laccase n=1 Tax=Anthurium amnicola TaxID=1678845 RepID=A0A1D1YEG2_9ARAE
MAVLSSGLHLVLVLQLSLLLSYSASFSSARPVQHWPTGRPTRFYDFKVQTTKITKLCYTKDIVTVNGMFPGPVLYAQEGDRVTVKVTNETPHNATIHWHGVHQRLTCWADGPAYITQCPIQPGQAYTYEFLLENQRGTLLWHAHVSWLRATVHGAIVIYPKTGVPYPFPHPYQEHIIILGEYWNMDTVQLERQVLASGGGAPPANAFTINGHPGPLYNCSVNDVYQLEVVPGKTYLLRIINAALNMEAFFTIADHRITIVAADADYTKPLTIDHLMLTPGQTVNALLHADQPHGRYAMAMGPYESGRGVTFQNISSVAYLLYAGAGNPVAVPARLPKYNDNTLVKRNLAGLRSLSATRLPLNIDRNLFFTVGLNADPCNRPSPNQNCQGTNTSIFSASMNNVSFNRPPFSVLQAYYGNIRGYYTADFPAVPLRVYDFVNGAPNNPPVDTAAVKGTKVFVLEYGERVQLVMQDTGTITTENHPMHLHGYSFYLVGFGKGNFNPRTANLNLVDPPQINTVGVPVGGWAVIRFIADNPGAWFMHCHLDIHLSWGLSMVFIVKNGKGPLETLPPPPADLPKC